ncbi:hypothetical protein CSAL01_02943 [Colletotrichum salicis]|uniref:Plastocyanin-like domain-containing protein n=1 Tax=Colletotrichum salicis TaxID=1209931 RepID=A0A135UYR2_9PEZI|nr:hypothetical protein CSAL01_02943 [Colletotrichum salicis]
MSTSNVPFVFDGKIIPSRLSCQAHAASKDKIAHFVRAAVTVFLAGEKQRKSLERLPSIPLYGAQLDLFYGVLPGSDFCRPDLKVPNHDQRNALRNGVVPLYHNTFGKATTLQTRGQKDNGKTWRSRRGDYTTRRFSREVEEPLHSEHLDIWPVHAGLLDSWGRHQPPSEQDRLTREYTLQSGVRWMNPDGGRWRVMFVCNGQTPCPTLYAEEGDLVALTVKSDVYAQSSIHWSGIGHKATGSWNDGTAGISQYSILPRGNFTSVITSVTDTSGSWGPNWYAEHTTAASADGLYSMIYVALSPSRLRPYRLITEDDIELRKIMEAEKQVRPFAIKNHQHRDTGLKMLRMRAEGSEFYCYDSILLGMSAPIMEGILSSDPAEFPASAVNRPHVEFEPKNDGVFG